MKLTRRAATLAGLSALATGTLSSRGNAFDGPIADLVEGAEDFGVALDAYVYGYPLVTMEMTRRAITNVPQVEGTRGPMGQIIKLRAYPDASYRDTAPNADTLYTTAFFDVGDEPWVLGVPDMKGRYFLLPFLDGWTNVFAVPGSRTTGTGAQTFVISGPGWSGAVPEGMTQLKSPTAIGGSIAPARLRTTPRFTPSRTRPSSSRSALGARIMCLPPGRSIRRST
jgi:hypothetical protein